MKSPDASGAQKRNKFYNDAYDAKAFYSHILSKKSPVIFDVGAHKGESIKYFASLYQDPKIFSFEPHPCNFIELSKVAKNHGTRCFEIAVGSKDGPIDFFKQDLTHIGGLSPINTKSLDSIDYASNALNQKIVVDCCTIDSFCAGQNITEVDILKIDTQGFEAEILKGAAKTLGKTAIVLVEIQLYDFYEKTKNSCFSVMEQMNNSGFSLWDISEISKNPKNLRTDWFEAIFVKQINSK